MSRTPQDVVSLYLRAQNLEQVRRTDEAVDLYEQAVAAGFDAAGPYDRLIAIYRAAERHGDVVRVATAALSHVRTFGDKHASYDALRDESRELLETRPDSRGPEF